MTPLRNTGNSPLTEQHDEPVTLSKEQAVEIIDVLTEAKNALHAHALGHPISRLYANALRRKIERALRG